MFGLWFSLKVHGLQIGNFVVLKVVPLTGTVFSDFTYRAISVRLSFPTMQWELYVVYM